MSRTITHEKAMEILKEKVKEAGSQLQLAKQLDISPQFLNDIFLGRRSISDNLAQKLGYRRVINFVKMED